MALYAVEGEDWACLDDIARCDLVFLDQGLRRLGLSSLGGVPVCLAERDSSVTCSSCGYCTTEA
jgi:hypothetical protein